MFPSVSVVNPFEVPNLGGDGMYVKGWENIIIAPPKTQRSHRNALANNHGCNWLFLGRLIVAVHRG